MAKRVDHGMREQSSVVSTAQGNGIPNRAAEPSRILEMLNKSGLEDDVSMKQSKTRRMGSTNAVQLSGQGNETYPYRY